MIRAIGGTPAHYVLFVISLWVVAALEVLGVGIIPIFIAVIAEPAKVRVWMERVLPALAANFTSEGGIVNATCWTLIALFAVKNACVGVITWLQVRFIAVRQAELSTRLLAIFMAQPYAFHIDRSSPVLQRIVMSDSFAVFLGTVMPAAQLVTEGLVVLLIAAILMVSYPGAAATAVLFLGGILFAFYRIFRVRLSNLGQSQLRSGAGMVKWITQGLGGIKEVKLLGREQYFVDAYSGYAREYAQAGAYIGVVSQTPRLFVEALVVGCMAGAVLIMSAREMPIQEMLPSLALFGVAAIRLMPSVNRILAALTLLRVHRAAVSTVLQTLAGTPAETAAHEYDPAQAGMQVHLERMLRIAGVNYSYPAAAGKALDSISVDIPHGAIYGIIGGSGAGKSTLVDILLGLHRPSAGSITADGKDIFQLGTAWQRAIGYVPQSIYIADDTILRNVAFGIRDDSIDEGLVWSALENAQLADFVRTLPEGLQTRIGEAGSRLSGGQRQRIGIARSLYGNPSVLVMDEATSALDNETENEVGAVMQRLKGGKTLIVVAHRLNTVKRCDRLLYLKDGRVAGEGTYQALFDADADFRRLMGELGHTANEHVVAG